MELIIIVLALVALGVAAQKWGVDTSSQSAYDGRSQHTSLV
jgi:hypothetical protein